MLSTPRSLNCFWYCTKLFDDLSNNRYSLWVLCWKIGFCNILRGKTNCLTEFNFIQIFFSYFMFRFKLQIECSSHILYEIKRKSICIFLIIFMYNFHCLRTYFIHQDSTRCETCNILNPIFVYL